MPAPANDNFANATTIAFGSTTAVSVVGASVEPTEFTQFGGGGGGVRDAVPYTVWHKCAPVGSTREVILSCSSFPDGYADGTTYFIAYLNLVDDPPAAIDTVRLIATGYISNTFTVTVPAGATLYVQVASIYEYEPDTAAPVEFDLILSEPPPELSADIFGAARVTANLTRLVAFGTANPAGHATLDAVLAVNSSYATINGSARATAVMWVDINPHVEDYGSPYPPSPGPYPFHGVNRRSGLQLYEASGPVPVSQIIDQHVTLESVDRLTNQKSPLDWAQNPVRAGSVNYSVERWIQLRFLAPFNSVEDLRVWLNPAPAMRPGWTLRFGTSATYSTPVATASTIATTPLPTADPGPGVQDLLGVSYLDGSADGTSLWVVIQAEVDPLVVTPGPVGDFSLETFDSAPLQLEMAWAET